MTFQIILECGGVCRAPMGIFFKLLCPGDIPSKAHKLLLNPSTIVGYEEICFETHHADLIIHTMQYIYSPIVDNTTTPHSLMEHWGDGRIWGEWDRVIYEYEVLKRKLLLNHCMNKQNNNCNSNIAVNFSMFINNLYVTAVFFKIST